MLITSSDVTCNRFAAFFCSSTVVKGSGRYLRFDLASTFTIIPVFALTQSSRSSVHMSWSNTFTRSHAKDATAPSRLISRRIDQNFSGTKFSISQNRETTKPSVGN